MTPEERLREAEDTIERWLCDLDAAHDGIVADARRTGATVVADAEAEAAVVLAGAKGQAAEVVAEAEAEAARLTSAARDRAEEIVAAAHHEARRVLDEARQHAVRLTREVVDEIATIRRLTADAAVALAGPPGTAPASPTPATDPPRAGGPSADAVIDLVTPAPAGMAEHAPRRTKVDDPAPLDRPGPSPRPDRGVGDPPAPDHTTNGGSPTPAPRSWLRRLTRR
jgi:vacuolar-type H+-ATPase subunit H